jgi:hypothetical protein
MRATFDIERIEEARGYGRELEATYQERPRYDLRLVLDAEFERITVIDNTYNPGPYLECGSFVILASRP